MKKEDSVISLAWPDMWTKQTNSKYDKYSHILGIAKKGRYKVGHAASILINHETGFLHYMDFGRYITSAGDGRIRDYLTDPDLTMKCKAIIDKNNKVTNIHEILREIKENPAAHGEGQLVASIYTGIDFNKAFTFAKKWQKQGMIPYGPFDQNGTNCSRFVTRMIREGKPNWITRFLLRYPYTLSPSPKFNVRIARSEPHYYLVTDDAIKEIKPSIFKKIGL